MVTNKVLAQWEIDSLLAGVGIGDSPRPGDHRQIKIYDFRRPDKFSKEHLRALQILHENFSRQFSTALSSYLRTGVNVHLSSIEQVLYDDYINQLPNPTLFCIVGMAPLPGRMTMEMRLDLAYLMLDRLLGGHGRTARSSRECTEIELALVRTLFKYALQALREAWSNVATITPTIEDIVLNPHIVHGALAGEATSLMIFEVKLFDAGGEISLCLPHSTVEPLLDQFSPQLLLGGGVHRDTERLDFRRPLKDVRVPITIELGTAEVSLRELAGLSVGDILRLDSGPKDPLIGYVAGTPKFTCVPGTLNRSMAVQIIDVLRSDEDQSDA